MFQKIKNALTGQAVLAAVFVIFIFCVGFAGIPALFSTVRNSLSAEDIDLSAMKDGVDHEYKNMLTFDAPFFQNKGTYINFNGLLAKTMGQQVMNNVVKLDDGRLTTITDYYEDVDESVMQLKKLYNRQQEKGKHFLFVMTPIQISPYDSQLPAGITDDANHNTDVLLAALEQEDIPYLDLRKLLYEEGIGFNEAFHRTDHHWKPETGFWAYTKIIEALETQGALEQIEPYLLDINNYTIEEYEDWFLGSSGRRTGIYYAGIDDLQVIYPDFETNISLKVAEGNASPEIVFNSGEFKDVVIDWEYIKEKDYFGSDPYEAYGYGNRGYKQYRNEDAPANQKILSIGDSFGNIPFTFLPLSIQTCDELDMRYFVGDFNSYYEEYDPDIVVIVVSKAVGSNNSYDFIPE